ncbi:hypothetical protein EDB19DRAFT_1833347 [Suillus lakei]|nr:hypothetical protein EDB19DRAFT_1833347 [Suillus lakei]
MAFLALPVINDQFNYHTKTAIIATELSTYCVYKRMGDDLPQPLFAQTAQVAFLLKVTKPFLGIHILAGISIIYSLLHALLMWGLCLFIFAFTASVSQMTNAVAAAVVFGVFLFILFSILMFLSNIYERQLVDLSHLYAGALGQAPSMKVMCR